MLYISSKPIFHVSFNEKKKSRCILKEQFKSNTHKSDRSHVCIANTAFSNIRNSSNLIEYDFKVALWFLFIERNRAICIENIHAISNTYMSSRVARIAIPFKIFHNDRMGDTSACLFAYV